MLVAEFSRLALPAGNGLQPDLGILTAIDYYIKIFMPDLRRETVRSRDFNSFLLANFMPCAALLENQEAHVYYREHSTSYRAAQTRKRTGKAAKVSGQAHSLHIDPHRDTERARYRYLQMTKPEIVERLLLVEQAYAELTEQARLQFALLEMQQAVHQTER